MMVPGLDSFYTSASSTATASPPSTSADHDFDDASRNPKRTPKACDRCRHKKTKCTGESPCQRCRLDNTVCSFTNRRPKEGPSFNPQVAQKDAAMSMLYKCIEVMNRQILTARLGPYSDCSLAEYAESEEFIIGIILDRFGISPVLDEFDNQPVYLPGQRGFNPETCAVEFPQYPGHREGYEEENYAQGAGYFNTQAGIPQGIYPPSTSRDVQMTRRDENRIGEFNTPIPAPQRHHTYTYGQQSVTRETPPLWTQENKLVDEPLLMQDIYPLELNSADSTGYIPTDSSPPSHQRQTLTPSVYEVQQAQIERIRREQLVQRNTHPPPSATSRNSPRLGSGGYTGLTRAQIPLPPHIAQVAEMEPVTTQWEYPSAVSSAGVTAYPSALCSARASPEIGGLRLGGRKTPSVRGAHAQESVIYPGSGSYMELSDPLGGTVRSMGW